MISLLGVAVILLLAYSATKASVKSKNLLMYTAPCIAPLTVFEADGYYCPRVALPLHRRVDNTYFEVLSMGIQKQMTNENLR